MSVSPMSLSPMSLSPIETFSHIRSSALSVGVEPVTYRGFI